MTERARHPLCDGGVVRPHGTGEAVVGVVGDADRLGLVAEALHRDDGPEHLLPHRGHVARAVGEHGGTQEEPVRQLRFGRTSAARHEPSTLGDRALDVTFHLGSMLGRNQRPALGAFVETVAEPDGVGPPPQFGDELVVDLVLHDQPGPGGTHLTGVDERGRERVVDGRVEVGVREDDVRVLPAEFQRDALHALGRHRHDLLSGGQTTRERDQVDGGVPHHRRSHVRPVAEYEVDHATGQARLLQQPDQRDRGEWCQLAGLEHHGVARRERGRDLPGDLQQRVVPRRDERAHPDGLVDDPADHSGISGVDHPAGLGVGEVRVVTEDVGDVVDVDASLGQRLARVDALLTRDLLPIALQQIRHPTQQFSALPGGGRGPRTVVEGAPGRGHGGVHVLRTGFGHGRHGAAVVGVEHGTTVGRRHRLDPGSVDVEVSHEAGIPLPRIRDVVHTTQFVYAGTCYMYVRTQ